MAKGSVKFLADEHVSPKIVAIINKLGDQSISSIRHGPFQHYSGTPDDYWIPEVTRNGFICVTCDTRMLIDRTIAPCLETAKARMIFLGRHIAESSLWDQALWWLKHWRQISLYAETMTPGQLVKVSSRGKITPVSPSPTRPRPRRSSP